jgi:hypothetical protein
MMNATRRARSLKIQSLELLDDRITPSGGFPLHPTTAVAPMYAPNGTAMDKLGQTLNIISQEFLKYEHDGGHGAFVSSQSKVLFHMPAGTTDGSKTEVGVNIQVKSNLDQVVSDMKTLGMEVSAVNRSTGMITGYLPISQLPTAANDAQITNVTPIYKPVTFGPVAPRPR